jgi:hypothetical protein
VIKSKKGAHLGIKKEVRRWRMKDREGPGEFYLGPRVVPNILGTISHRAGFSSTTHELNSGKLPKLLQASVSPLAKWA